MRRELEQVEIPDEHGARERTWTVVRSAFAEQAPVERRSLHLRPAIVLVVAVALLAAAFSSPGMAVLDRIRKTVGIERAAPALFSLPSPGKLLVRTDEGVWVVQQDGSRRFLGRYRAAGWSPFGRFVVATRTNELAALEPGGDVHWTLARPKTRFPSWGGTRDDTRIAYSSGEALRIVAGDGTNDHPGCGGVIAGVAAAWKPGSTRAVALAGRDGSVEVVAPDTCRRLWRARHEAVATKLQWSSDGSRLLVLTPPGLRVFDAKGRLVAADDPSDEAHDADAAFVPGSREVLVIRVHGSQSDVLALGTGRSLFHVAGMLAQIAPSPDGRWLLATWPNADQWIFVRADGRGIRAVSNISGQFRSEGFPTLEGWAP